MFLVTVTVVTWFTVDDIDLQYEIRFILDLPPITPAPWFVFEKLTYGPESWLIRLGRPRYKNGRQRSKLYRSISIFNRNPSLFKFFELFSYSRSFIQIWASMGFESEIGLRLKIESDLYIKISENFSTMIDFFSGVFSGVFSGDLFFD